MMMALLIAATLNWRGPHIGHRPGAIADIADDGLSLPAGSPSAVAVNMARRAIDPAVSEAERRGDRQTYFSENLQAFEKRMTDDQWRDFDADEVTGTQDSGGWKVESATQGMIGHDIEVIVLFSTGAKDKVGKAINRKVGYDMKQNAAGEWKVDDIEYLDGDESSSFREIASQAPNNP